MAAAAAPLIVDEIPQPLTTQQTRTESQQDRLDAVALFSAGRMHQHRQKYPEALRCYQRAFRLDPNSAEIIRALVPVAAQLKRYDEAVRYALKTAEQTDADPMLLRRLGAYLAEIGDFAQAVTLYDKALAASDRDKPAATDVLLWMEAGRLYYLSEKPKQAADCFRRVIRALENPAEFGLDEQVVQSLLGKSEATYQMIGECFLAADAPDDALAAFERAEQSAPDESLRQFNLARIHARRGKPAEALAALEASFAAGIGGFGAAPYETLAAVLESLDKKNELLDRLRTLYAADPENKPLAYFLAAEYSAAGQLDQAESIYRKLLEDKPSLPAYRGLFDLYRKSKRYDSLLDVFGEAIERKGVLDVLGTESQTISADKETMSGLLQSAHKRIEVKDGSRLGHGAMLGMAVLALEAGEYETAGEFFNLYVAAKPEQAAEALMVWGVGLLTADRPAEAVEVFQRGILLEQTASSPPEQPEADAQIGSGSAFHFYLAGALALAGRTDEALSAAESAAIVRPESARFAGRKAWVLYFAKRYNEAARAYCELLERYDADHTSADNRLALRDARLALSNMAVVKGDLSQAEEWLEQVLDEFPDDYGAMNDLGYLWADGGKHLERAKRMIERAVEVEPDNAAFRDSLGWVLFRLGNYDEAVAELEKAAAATKPPDAVVLDHLGDAYDKSGQHQKAVEMWRKAAELYKQEKELEKAASVEKKIDLK